MSSDFSVVDQQQISSNSDNFVKRPGKGWLHNDVAMQDGVTYNVKYVGCIGVNESMKSLNFETRTLVARESIRRVAECAKCLNYPRRYKKNDEQLNAILSNECNVQWTGMNIALQVNTQYLKATQLECNEVLFQHTMQNISFACGGDADIRDFVAYVAKDDNHGRACYVFECLNGLANKVITTIGQAFELRFKKFLTQMPNLRGNAVTTTTSSAAPAGKPVPASPIVTTQNENKNSKPQAPMPSSNLGGGTPKLPFQNKFDLPYGQQPTVNETTNNTTKQTVAKPNSNALHLHDSNNNTVAPPTSKAAIIKPIDEKLESMPWFHGLLTRDNAEKLLTKDGDYLVRETNKADRQYVLSGRYKGECRHIFLVDPSGVVRTKDRVFDSICHLIKYHQDNFIPIISKDNELLLEHPVCKRSQF